MWRTWRATPVLCGGIPGRTLRPLPVEAVIDCRVQTLWRVLCLYVGDRNTGRTSPPPRFGLGLQLDSEPAAPTRRRAHQSLTWPSLSGMALDRI